MTLKIKKNMKATRNSLEDLYDKAVFTSNLIKILVERGLTETEGADICNIEPHTFSLYLRGVTPDLMDLKKITEGLRVSRAFLAGKEECSEKKECGSEVRFKEDNVRLTA